MKVHSKIRKRIESSSKAKQEHIALANRIAASNVIQLRREKASRGLLMFAAILILIGMTCSVLVAIGAV